MVGTRNHPVDFDEPQTASPKSSPRKRATRTSTANHATPTKTESPPPSPTKTRPSAPSRRKGQWSHTPSNLSLIWLAVSLPLVVWDFGYVLLRPHSMPGGWLHAPWKPYAFYGIVDHVYGFKAWNSSNGWTAAQSAVNVVETSAYLVYLYLVYKYGEQEPRQGSGAPDRSVMGEFRALSESRTVTGRVAAWAVLLMFATSTVTFWKTILYWLIEAFSGFDNIGHNDWSTLFFAWIIPNGAWIVLPGYFMYVMGEEVLDGLEIAASRRR